MSTPTQESGSYPQDDADLANTNSGAGNPPRSLPTKPAPGPDYIIIKGGPGKAPEKSPPTKK